MLRCAASFVIAAYAEVRLIPQDLRALPAELFTKPSKLAIFSTFYTFIKIHFQNVIIEFLFPAVQPVVTADFSR
jgi:hypothetical protein